MNAFLKYYGEYNISPVTQDISDIYVHYKKREKLYRQLGMPPIIFRNANILEVGPGSGYNTLAFFEWGGVVHLVEPNPTGINDINRLFKERNISKSCYELYQKTIEDFRPNQSYDIIIAEGFLHSVDNSKMIIDKLKNIVHPGGVVVITCMDEMSMFVEQMKRLICHYKILDINVYEDQVKVCTRLFKPQFDRLNGMSRNVEDWVRDDMLNPAFNNKVILNLEDAIRAFGDEFYVLGSSQKIFTDYSWYKDLSYSECENCINQFKDKQHIFLMTGIDENNFNQYERDFLKQQISEIRKKCILFEENSIDVIDDIIELLKSIKHLAVSIDKKLLNFINDCILILNRISKEETFELEEYRTFFHAVGRTQQYLSMVRKYNY